MHATLWLHEKPLLKSQWNIKKLLKNQQSKHTDVEASTRVFPSGVGQLTPQLRALCDTVTSPNYKQNRRKDYYTKGWMDECGYLAASLCL